MVLFGEGTSSDGNRVLAVPHRADRSGAATRSPKPSTSSGCGSSRSRSPIPRLLGLPLGRHARNRVAWYGDAPLWPHLSWLVARGAIDVVVTWGEPVAYDEASDRKAVARQLERAVRRHTMAALRGKSTMRFRSRPARTAHPRIPFWPERRYDRGMAGAARRNPERWPAVTGCRAKEIERDFGCEIECGGNGLRKLYVKSYGCQMNVYDSASYGGPAGAARAMSRPTGPEDADLVILNTCHIREKAAEKVYSELGRVRAAQGRAPRARAGA